LDIKVALSDSFDFGAHNSSNLFAPIPESPLTSKKAGGFAITMEKIHEQVDSKLVVEFFNSNLDQRMM
jgi:hypothetical protein